MLQELLVDQLRDLLPAENQLVKALPQMINAAHASGLRLCFEEHLEETREQVERLKQSLELLDVQPKAKPCKGMAGLVEEGQEVIAAGEDKEPEAGRSGLDRRGAEGRALRDVRLQDRPHTRLPDWPRDQHSTISSWLPSSSASSLRSATSSTGLTTWASNPASSERRRSSACPHPVKATRTGRLL